MLYSIFRFLFQIIFVVFYRFEVKGHEHVPVSGPVIICSNHISNLDPPVVGSSMKRKVRFMAKEELFHIPVVSFLIRKFGTFPIKRGAIDKQGLRNALKLLKDGEVLGIFPEGTRSKSGELGQAFPGAAMFALKSQAPVIPVAIIGPYKPFKQLNIVIGKPIDLTRFYADKINSEQVSEATTVIMQHISALIEQHKGNGET